MFRNRLLGCFLASICAMTSLISTQKSQKGVYDYIIIGNGTTGAVLASKLTKDRKHNVLVLETGPNLAHDPESADFDAKAYSVTYPVELSTGFSQSITYSEAQLWGGSSAAKSNLAVHGTPEMYDSWAASSGNSRWMYKNVLATIRHIETYTPNATAANALRRGDHGPISVTQNPPVDQNPLALGISSAAFAPIVNDYNDPTEGNIGVSSLQQFVTKDGLRSFSINGYLPDAVVTADGRGKNNRKLRIVSQAHVARIIFDNNKAIGVECVISGAQEKVQRAFAKKKVILAAGAINSPAILQRSGIGDAALLTSLGIPVVVNNPNVGKNLVARPGCVVYLGGNSPDPIQAMINGSPYYPNDTVRRIQYLTNEGAGAILSYGFIVDPQSRGSVQIVSQNPFANPKLDLNMYSDGAVTTPGTDLYTIVSFLKIVQQIAADAGMTVLSPTAADYGMGDAGLATFAQSNPNIILRDQLTSSCRMATSAKDGVVDGNLHVFGTKHLMVADLSVTPAQPDASLSFPAYVIASEAAHIILGK